MSSNDLISALQKNDKAARKEAFDTYYGKLAAIAHRYAKNNEQAEEMIDLGFSTCFQKFNNSACHRLPNWTRFLKENLSLPASTLLKTSAASITCPARFMPPARAALKTTIFLKITNSSILTTSTLSF